MATLEPGDHAPDFTLIDQDGEPWTLSEHRGRPVVVYFFPKADTPGCTTQACDVRDHWGAFTDLGAAVVGISPDDPAAMARFAENHELPHRLLGDPDRTTIEAYRAWGERSMYGKTYQGVVRSCVVLDADGAVATVFSKIQPKQQSAKALAAVRALA